MLDKLKIAMVLMIIGMVSGLLIWGTHTLTVERIEANRERARLAVYVDMFPDVDVTKMTFETIEHSAVFEKITMIDANGALLGYVFRGRDVNAIGYVNVAVGITPQGDIVDVVITDHDNTDAPYVQDLQRNILVKLKGQTVDTITYDVGTGATITYDSVKRVLNDAVLLVAGDPVLEAYQTIFENATRYETHSFTLGAVQYEVAIIDASDTIIGYVYQGDIVVNDQSFTIGVATDSRGEDAVFLGLILVEEDADTDVINAFDAFDGYVDTAVTAIDFDISGDIELQLESLIEAAFMRSLESETERALREFFIDAAYQGDKTDINDDTLTSETPVYDKDDNLIGYIYRGEAEGYSFDAPIVLDVAITFDDVISAVQVVSHDESAGVSDRAFNNLDGYVNLDDAIDYDTDVYTGATITGNTILDIVKAAQDYNRERNGG